MEIQKLSVSERIDLAQRLWDSVLADQGTLELSQAQKDELDARLRAYEVDKNPGEKWDVVKARILGK